MRKDDETSTLLESSIPVEDSDKPQSLSTAAEFSVEASGKWLAKTPPVTREEDEETFSIRILLVDVIEEE